MTQQDKQFCFIDRKNSSVIVNRVLQKYLCLGFSCLPF